MPIIAKECIVGFYDETKEYNEIKLQEGKEYIFSFKGVFDETDNGRLMLDSDNDRIQIDVDDICGIKEV